MNECAKGLDSVRPSTTRTRPGPIRASTKSWQIRAGIQYPWVQDQENSELSIFIGGELKIGFKGFTMGSGSGRLL